jgi:hypothetical protein
MALFNRPQNPQEHAAAAAAKAAYVVPDGAPQVGMTVLYKDPHGAPAVPAIIAAANVDGSYDVTIFAPVTVLLKSVRVGWGVGQLTPLPTYKAFLPPPPPVVAKPAPVKVVPVGTPVPALAVTAKPVPVATAPAKPVPVATAPKPAVPVPAPVVAK